MYVLNFQSIPRNYCITNFSFLCCKFLPLRCTREDLNWSANLEQLLLVFLLILKEDLRNPATIISHFSFRRSRRYKWAFEWLSNEIKYTLLPHKTANNLFNKLFTKRNNYIQASPRPYLIAIHLLFRGQIFYSTERESWVGRLPC